MKNNTKFGTLAAQILDPKMYENENIVKVKTKEPLKENQFPHADNFLRKTKDKINIYYHIGIYCYGVETLKKIISLKQSKNEIITFDGAFHGRTFAALSAQKNKKYSKGYGPLLSGFKKVKFNNEKKLMAAINKKTAGIIIEPIQGEGGIRPANLKFLKLIRKICDQRGILMLLDEVQCGFGRSGKLFSHEWAKIKPDLMAVAKGIGSGFPLGACLSTNKACVSMIKGSHGSTYGGNPLAMSVGLEVLKIISNKKFLKRVDKVSRYFWKKLKELENQFTMINEVRGAGLLLGIKTNSNNIEFSEKLKNLKLLNVPAADNTIRLAPPLIVSYKEIDKSVAIIKKVLEKYND